MTYFKLDVPKINENISSYEEIKNDFLEDIDLVYKGLGYTESAWNDSNAYSFIEIVKKDKYKINEYFTYLSSLYNEINKFKTNIDNLCNKHGYKKNTIILKFDDSAISQIIKYLENARWYLYDSLNKININSFGIDYDLLNSLYNLRSQIKSMVNLINNIINDINNFVKAVKDEIIDSGIRLKRLGSQDFDLKVFEHKWRVVDHNTKKINVNTSDNLV